MAQGFNQQYGPQGAMSNTSSAMRVWGDMFRQVGGIINRQIQKHQMAEAQREYNQYNANMYRANNPNAYQSTDSIFGMNAGSSIRGEQNAMMAQAYRDNGSIFS